jgi:hypothetical protein
MMIFIAILIILGLVTKQPREYWIYSTAAVLIQFVLGYLLAAGGTLENPQGDGVITHFVRQAVDGGPLMGLWGLFVITVAWGVPIFIVTRSYTKKPKDSNEPTSKT